MVASRKQAKGEEGYYQYYHSKIDLVRERVSKKGLSHTHNGVFWCWYHMVPPATCTHTSGWKSSGNSSIDALPHDNNPELQLIRWVEASWMFLNGLYKKKKKKRKVVSELSLPRVYSHWSFQLVPMCSLGLFILSLHGKKQHGLIVWIDRHRQWPRVISGEILL